MFIRHKSQNTLISPDVLAITHIVAVITRDIVFAADSTFLLVQAYKLITTQSMRGIMLVTIIMLRYVNTDKRKSDCIALVKAW